MTNVLPILIGIAVLLCFSAFFSGSETALMSLSKAQLKRLQNGSRRDRLVYGLLKDTGRVLGTILLGNLFVNTMLTALTAELIARYIASPLWSSLASIAIVTPVLILFGELMPKVNGLHFNLAFSRFCAPPLLLLSYLLTPFLILLNCATPLIKRLQGSNSTESSWGVLTNAELVATFDAAESAGASTNREHALLERVLTFGTIEAKEIMVPRPYIVGIDDSLSLKEAFSIAHQNQFSHFPVYHKNIDEIWGVVVFTDILRFFGTPLASKPLSSFRGLSESSGDSQEANTPVLPVEFVPGTARIERILADLRKNSQSMAVAVSEYGGTLGVVTRSMILEEIVGKYAFSGRDANRLQKHHDGYLADGRARLRLVEDALEFEFDTQTETLAGFVMERLGKIPVAGDSFQENGYRFQVVRTVGKLAGAITITPISQTSQKEAAS